MTTSTVLRTRIAAGDRPAIFESAISERAARRAAAHCFARPQYLHPKNSNKSHVAQIPSAPTERIGHRIGSQLCSDRIFKQIARMPEHRLIASKRMIEIPGLPNGAVRAEYTVNLVRASAFQQMHVCGECSLAQFEQPMQVVRHDHPSDGFNRFASCHTAQFIADDHGHFMIQKERSAAIGHRRDRVDSARFRVAAEYETWAGHDVS